MDVFLSLSPEFQRKATITAALSYREVGLNTIYQRPDCVDIVQEMDVQMTDRVETGLDKAVLIRAGLENPQLMPHLRPFIRTLNEGHVFPGQDIKSEMESAEKYSQPDGDSLTSRQRSALEARASGILDRAFEIASEFPHSFSIDFKSSARQNGNFVPTKADNISDLAKASFSTPLAYLKRTKEFFEGWILNVEGALNQTVIRSKSLADEPEALAQAHKYLEERYRKLHTGGPKGFFLD